MQLEDLREHLFEISGKASGIARQLTLAGIGIVWLLKKDINGNFEIPEQLLWALLLLASVAIMDLLQYLVNYLFLDCIYMKEERNQSKNFKLPKFIPNITRTFFYGKFLFLFLGYGCIFEYFLRLLIFR